MAEVPDHLAPASRVSNARVRFAGLDTLEGGGAVFRFDVFQAEKQVGTFSFEVRPSGRGNTDGLIALAHQKMNDALRQMLQENELARQAYEKRSA